MLSRSNLRGKYLFNSRSRSRSFLAEKGRVWLLLIAGVCYQLQKRPERNFRIPFCVLFPFRLYSERMDLSFQCGQVVIPEPPAEPEPPPPPRMHFMFPKQKPFKIHPRSPAARSEHGGRRLCALMETVNQNLCPWRRTVCPSRLENVAGNIEDDQEQTSNPDARFKRQRCVRGAHGAGHAFTCASVRKEGTDGDSVSRSC